MKKTLMALTLVTLGMAGLSHGDAGNPTLDRYVLVSEALANDNLPAVKSLAAALAETARAEKQESLAANASEIASSDSIETARQSFQLASQDAVKLAVGQEGYYVMTCPMAKADWVQKTDKVQNPYMGKAMLQCGSLKDPQTRPVAPRTGGCCG